MHLTMLRSVALGVACATLLAGTSWAEPPSILSRTVKPDGSSHFTVGRRFDALWESKFGVDLSLPSAAGVDQFDRPGPPAVYQTSSGAAWAKVTVPSFAPIIPWERASLEARIDPQNEQGKVGTSFSRSVPLGSTLSLTLQNGYSLLQPLSIPAPDGTPSAATTPQVWATDQTVSLAILPTGTKISAGATLTSTESQWLRTISAEQRLIGPLSVTSSVSETPTGELNRRIGTSMKWSW